MHDGGMTSWIDTHCHLDAPEFTSDRTDVRNRARAAGVAHCVLPAVEVGNFQAVHQLAHRHGDSYALGIHPLAVTRAVEDDLVILERALGAAIADPHLVAVGEIGLDLFEPGHDPQRQEEFLHAQLLLAQRFGLPVILHVRRSADRLLKYLRQVRVKGIAHAFNGSAQQAQEFVDLGFKLGFGGTLTYERSLQIRRLAASLPADAVVVETDSPDIPPQWLYRTAEQRTTGLPQGRNEPAELPKIGRVLADLRNTRVETLAEQTRQNAIDALPRLAALLP